MKIAITSTGRDLASKMDPRFGRAAYFIVVDLDTMQFEAIDNQQVLNLAQGAGIQSSKNVVDQEVQVLITGHCGPKAFQVLKSAGVSIFLGAHGSVADAIAQYKSGRLQAVDQPDVAGHWV